jgi:hypothetical protein
VPAGFDRVTVALERNRSVALNLDAGEALVDRLRDVRTVWPRLCDEFEEAGTSRPVFLASFQRSALLDALDDWSRELEGNAVMPDDILELRNALVADLRVRLRRQASDEDAPSGSEHPAW